MQLDRGNRNESNKHPFQIYSPQSVSCGRTDLLGPKSEWIGLFPIHSHAISIEQLN